MHEGDPPTWTFKLSLLVLENIGPWLSISPYSSNPTCSRLIQVGCSVFVTIAWSKDS